MDINKKNEIEQKALDAMRKEAPLLTYEIVDKSTVDLKDIKGVEPRVENNFYVKTSYISEDGKEYSGAYELPYNEEFIEDLARDLAQGYEIYRANKEELYGNSTKTTSRD